MQFCIDIGQEQVCPEECSEQPHVTMQSIADSGVSLPEDLQAEGIWCWHQRATLEQCLIMLSQPRACGHVDSTPWTKVVGADDIDFQLIMVRAGQHLQLPDELLWSCPSYQLVHLHAMKMKHYCHNPSREGGIPSFCVNCSDAALPTSLSSCT